MTRVTFTPDPLVPGNGGPEVDNSTERFFISMDLAEGEARMVVNADMHIFPAIAANRSAARAGLACALARHTVARAFKPPQFPDVEMDQVARGFAFIAAHLFGHIFDRVCRENAIEHRLTKIGHPWTNGQVERMNRTIKDATVKLYYYDTHDQLRSHLTDFINAYNYARRLKILKGLTPYEYVCKMWTKEPERFTLNPTHQMPGLNTPRNNSFRRWQQERSR